MRSMPWTNRLRSSRLYGRIMSGPNLHAQLGDDKAALADCEAALKLEPQDPDAAWIKREIAKPASERFRGKFKSSPSSNR